LGIFRLHSGNGRAFDARINRHSERFRRFETLEGDDGAPKLRSLPSAANYEGSDRTNISGAINKKSMRLAKAVVGTVLLAVAAQPIHESGHAIMLRLLAGTWPKLTFWAVEPGAILLSRAAVLAVLVAGDLAVLGWWGAVFMFARRSPGRRWMLLGPTFMLAFVLAIWITAAALSPFGYDGLEASDAAKFLAVANFGRWTAPVIVTGIALVIGTRVTILARHYLSSARVPVSANPVGVPARRLLADNRRMGDGNTALVNS
jgi:hypothetical protein